MRALLVAAPWLNVTTANHVPDGNVGPSRMKGMTPWSRLEPPLTTVDAENALEAPEHSQPERGRGEQTGIDQTWRRRPAQVACELEHGRGSA